MLDEHSDGEPHFDWTLSQLGPPALSDDEIEALPGEIAERI
jgi:hypothetical protein